MALAHDLGHTPFGHAGEEALDAVPADIGGFDHNAHALRLVTKLEHRYADFDGLNLTWETLEGLVKHNGPLTDRAGRPVGRYAEQGVPAAIRLYGEGQDLQLWSYPSAEAQAAAIADDIAYDAHDIDDGLRAELFGLGDLGDVALAGDILREISARYPGSGGGQGGPRTGPPPHHPHDRGRDRAVRWPARGVRCPLGRRCAQRGGAADRLLAGDGRRAEAGIKGFLYPRMYRHPARRPRRRRRRRGSCATCSPIIRARPGRHAGGVGAGARRRRCGRPARGASPISSPA